MNNFDVALLAYSNFLKELEKGNQLKIVNLIDGLSKHKTRKWAKRKLSDISELVVHQALSEGSVENIAKYHVTPGNHIFKNGLPALAYTFAIRRNGEIIQANHLESILAHTKGYNKTGIGIMMAGNFDAINYLGTQVPTNPQLTNLILLLDYLLDKLNLPITAVQSHTSLTKKLSCPGIVTEAVLNEYRRGKTN